MDDLERVLMAIAAWGSIGAFIDFFLGRAGQKRAKEYLEDWWYRLSYVNFSNFGREEAKLAVGAIDRVFGARLFSFRRFLASFCVGLVCYAAILSSVIFTEEFAWFPFYLRSEWINGTLEFLVGLIVCIISVSVTRFLASQVSRRLKDGSGTNALALGSLIYCQLLANNLSRFLDRHLNNFVMIFAGKFHPENPQQADLWGALNMLVGEHYIYRFRLLEEIGGVIYNSLTSPLHFLWGYGGLFDLIEKAYVSDPFQALGLAGRLLPLAVGALRIFLLMFFFACVMLQPLQQFILTIWQRILESDKPVFTITFAGAAAVAKSVQEIIKTL